MIAKQTQQKRLNVMKDDSAQKNQPNMKAHLHFIMHMIAC
jgi:hypothetical protein